MAKLKVYYNKLDDLNQYGVEQWLVMNPEMTSGSFIIFKQITLPFDNPLVIQLVNSYNSSQWQEYTLKSKNDFYEGYYKRIGLDFVKNGDNFILNVENEETKKTLCTWRIELDTTDPDHLFRLAPFDFAFPNPLYAAKVIDMADEAKMIIADLCKKGMAGIKYLEANA